MTIDYPGHRLLDFLFFLSVVRVLPGPPHRLFLSPEGVVARHYFAEVEAFIGEFVPEIDYICVAEDPVADLSFRRAVPKERSSLHSQALWCGISPAALNPQWVAPRKPPEWVVISRDSFQKDAFFPWEKVFHHYALERFVFCGPPVVFDNWSREWSLKDVEFIDSRDLVGVASAMTRASLYVGGQTAALPIAEGVQVPVVLDVSLSSPDCLIARPGFFPSFCGRAYLPGVREGDSGVWVENPLPLSLASSLWEGVSISGWSYQLPDRKFSQTFDSLQLACSVVADAFSRRRDDPQVMEAIINFTISKHPEEFIANSHCKVFRKALAAWQVAGGRDVASYFSPPDLPAIDLRL